MFMWHAISPNKNHAFFLWGTLPQDMHTFFWYDFDFDIDIALINGLYGASITMLLLRRRIYWTQTSANKGNDFYLILLGRLFISQTKQFQWSDREHSVAVTSDFLKISNRHPRLVFWLILKHLERRMNSNMEALFSLLLMSGMLMTLWSSGRLDNSNNRCQDVKSYILRETLCLHPDILVLQQLSVNHLSVCRGGV